MADDNCSRHGGPGSRKTNLEPGAEYKLPRPATSGKRLLPAKDIAPSKMAPLAVGQAFRKQSGGDAADPNHSSL